MSLASGDPRHGTENGYGNLGCRCEPCRKAHAAAHLAYMHRSGRSQRTKAEHIAETTKHGVSRYTKGGCRCAVCRAAKTAEKRRHRERHRVPCVGCGAMVLGELRVPKPPECHPCAVKRLAAEGRLGRKRAA